MYFGASKVIYTTIRMDTLSEELSTVTCIWIDCRQTWT